MGLRGNETDEEEKKEEETRMHCVKTLRFHEVV